MSPVGDVLITSPEEGKVLNYNDIIFKYEGAENADKVVLDIYNGNRLIKSKTLRSNRAVISSEFFEKSKKYTIKIDRSNRFEENNCLIDDNPSAFGFRPCLIGC